MDAKDGLSIDDDPEFSMHAWRVRRIARVAMILFVAAAAAGLLGEGGFSRRELRSADRSLELEYDRLAHVHSPLRLRITAATLGADLRLWLDKKYWLRMHVESVNPSPARVSSTQECVLFEFDVAEGARSSEVVIDLEAVESGCYAGRIGIVEGAELQFAQTLLP